MKKTKCLKLLLLLLITSSIYFIYQLSNKNNIIYLSLGDTFLVSEEYNYLDLIIKDLEDNHLLNFGVQEYMNSEHRLLDIYQDIKQNRKVRIKGQQVNIRHLLRDSNFVTISVGLNDLREKLDAQNGVPLDIEKSKQIIADIETRLDQAINEIKKYYKKDIYLIGFYDLYPSNQEKSLMVKQLNIMYRESAKRNNIIFIDISDFRSRQTFLYSIGNYLLLKEDGSKELARRVMMSFMNWKYDKITIGGHSDEWSIKVFK